MKKAVPFKIEKLEYPSPVKCDGGCGTVTKWITAVWPFKPRIAGDPPKKRLCSTCASNQYSIND